MQEKTAVSNTVEIPGPNLEKPMAMTTAAIVAEMVLAALKRGAELSENTTDDQLVNFAAWLLNNDLIRSWLDGTEAAEPLVQVPAELNFDPDMIAKWLPVLITMFKLFRDLRGK